ncbi:SMI1/KNR4 family protein [Bartonella refiksaydamii]|uniref:SMI1/KNR4 family protein n=1 Tax=Bartonella refiksaydamii TaxID=2654951 RepID=UPI0012EB1C9B|nr:SMI1/KNR4 family protein [Bartonella refiksaydamii]
MKTYTLSDVAVLIDKVNKYNGDIINFGTEDDAVDDLVIEKAEKILELQFTSSYKSFLKNYGRGEICGEEVFSVYNTNFEIARSDDIVYRNLNDIKNGLAKPQQLVVSKNDFGEILYFDYSQFQNGECALYFDFPPSDPQYYASNFYEFLCKRIIEHAGG